MPQLHWAPGKGLRVHSPSSACECTLGFRGSGTRDPSPTSHRHIRGCGRSGVVDLLRMLGQASSVWKHGLWAGVAAWSSSSHLCISSAEFYLPTCGVRPQHHEVCGTCWWSLTIAANGPESGLVRTAQNAEDSSDCLSFKSNNWLSAGRSRLWAVRRDPQDVGRWQGWGQPPMALLACLACGIPLPLHAEAEVAAVDGRFGASPQFTEMRLCLGVETRVWGILWLWRPVSPSWSHTPLRPCTPLCPHNPLCPCPGPAPRCVPTPHCVPVLVPQPAVSPCHRRGRAELLALLRWVVRGAQGSFPGTAATSSRGQTRSGLSPVPQPGAEILQAARNRMRATPQTVQAVSQ